MPVVCSGVEPLAADQESEAGGPGSADHRTPGPSVQELQDDGTGALVVFVLADLAMALHRPQDSRGRMKVFCRKS